MSITTPTRKNAPSLSARSKLVKTAAALTLAAAATLAVPSVANAYVPTPEPGAAVSSSTVATGGAVSFFVAPGTFQPGETVTIYLSGENAAGASLAMIRVAAVERQELGVREANDDGSLPAVDIKLPANASGTYEVLATSPSLPDGVTASFRVSADAGAGDRTDTTAALPPTGFDGGSLLGVWVGGGILVLAGGAIAVGASIHRGRHETSA